MTIQTIEWVGPRACYTSPPLRGWRMLYLAGDEPPRYPLPVTEDVSCAYHMYLWHVFTVEWNGTD